MKGRALTIVLLLAAAGCADDPLRPVDVAGDYALSSVDGESLPVEVLQTENGLTFATTGSLTLTDGGDYDLAVEFETSSGGPGDIILRSSFRDSGKYDLRQDDRIVFFSSISQGDRIGTATGSRVSVSIDVPGADKEIRLSFSR